MAKEQLRKPEYWTDFEDLCKRLWGEIWECPEIKKNGRNGQKQNGVDVYGSPKAEQGEYYGIQCKAKDENINAELTINDIDTEIDNAKSFQPELKKLYFATTANKDVKIEEYVRKKNKESIKAGLFEIHLYSWEDIVDLIDESKQTHDWYVKKQNFKTNKQAIVTFENGSTEITLEPKFRQDVIQYYKKDELELESGLSNLSSYYDRPFGGGVFESMSAAKTETNYSFVGFYFIINNIGIESIHNFKLLFELNGLITDWAETNEEHTGILSLPSANRYITDVVLLADSFTGKIIPQKRQILVGDDTYGSDDIYIKPSPIEQRIEVKWKLLADEYKNEGSIYINIQPNIKKRHLEKPFISMDENSEEIQVEEKEITDYIEIVRK